MEQEGEQVFRHPQKKFYRQRAHCNPLADNFMVHPLGPDYVDWELHFPNYNSEEGGFKKDIFLNTKKYPVKYSEERVVSERSDAISRRLKILDVGCGYGGLLVWLSEHFKDKLSLGLEIREKVTNYVGERILSMQQSGTGRNISVIKTNAMKYLPNYITRHQLEMIFICFPDPHFKKRNWRRRIVSYSTVPLFWYLLQEGGLIYIVTDVYDYYLWAVKVMDNYKTLFERVPDEELASDPCVSAIKSTTEEAKKVERSNSPAYSCVYKTIPFRVLGE
ncbi:putative methyltransferase-related [Cryptosporidium canis]|uniref:tRNA (guanine-N(7)-)-methyltransferase n=1 Tax=Cryptosporidium canis TaxID=195482 RepID=A0ABQ8P615_9CRYT|nr:putative methyltransferase-related [Cryptosporidium canis]KAJ1609775.1 putative methyltransferase-related [Cryptosporidium canis]